MKKDLNIQKNEFRKRLKKLDALHCKVDAIVLFNQDEPFKDVNYFYFTGNDSSHSLFLYDFSEAKILTNPLEFPKVKCESAIKNIKVFEKRGKISESIRKNLGSAKIIGVSETFPFFLAKKLHGRIANITEELESIRAIKSKNEIKNIQYACKVSDRMFENLHDFIKPSVSEKEIMQFIKTETIKNNCDLPSFNPVVNSGVKTSIPHDTQPSRKLSRNDIVMIDISCVYKKHYSDCTKMFFIGRIDKEIKKQYELLTNALSEAINSTHIDMKARSIDASIRKKIGPLAKNFIHASGHGLGLAPHEKPRISPNSKDIFKEGMAFALEPAIYFKNYGLRIEDTFLLTKKGVKILTKPKVFL